MVRERAGRGAEIRALCPRKSNWVRSWPLPRRPIAPHNFRSRALRFEPLVDIDINIASGSSKTFGGLRPIHAFHAAPRPHVIPRVRRTPHPWNPKAAFERRVFAHPPLFGRLSTVRRSQSEPLVL